MRFASVLLAGFISFSACAAPPTPADAAAPTTSAAAAPATNAAFQALPEAQRRAYEGADIIVVATLVDPKIDSVAEKVPPIYIHSFGLTVEKQILGMPLPAGRVRFSSEDPRHKDAFAAGARMIVAVQLVEQTLEGARVEAVALRVEPATPAVEAALAGAFAPAPEGLRISVAQVPPANRIQWQNDYGDGLFDLTITNLGKAPREVPGLSTDGGRARWEDALVIREGGRSLRLAATRPTAPAPLVLAPGASVTTRVDVKPFGLQHPAGGEGRHYSFAVGALRASSFFYYSHQLHGPQMGKP